LKQDAEQKLQEVAQSPPAWGRGLKLYELKRPAGGPGVAPRVGAWIETEVHTRRIVERQSPPAWGRGLKL